MPRHVTVADLPTSTLDTGVTLYCRGCREHYSATRGDYFATARDTVLTCCGEPMVLARRVTMVEEVMS